MDKKVYIATFFTWKSYGAVLQAAALNRFLNDQGYDARTIDYEFQDLDRKKPHYWRKAVKDRVRDLLIRRHEWRSKAFIHKHIRLTEAYRRAEDLKQLDADNVFFVAGSDQIWNAMLCHDFFFLRFVSKGKKLSYAASMGNCDIPEKNKVKFERYIREMDRISVRESAMLPVVGTIAKQPCEWHIDPTLLMPQERWSNCERPYLLKKPYILVYPLYWNPEYNMILQRLNRQTGLDIVALSASRKVFCTRRILNADPGQFLYLIHHAEGVVTSSFHGTVFSLIYRKPLGVVVNPAAPDRIEDLLERFGFRNAIIQSNTQDLVHLDYLHFEAQLEKERKRTQRYFAEMIGDPND